VDPLTRATLSANIRKIWDATKGSSGTAGRVARAGMYPLFGAAALAPVVGYEADRYLEAHNPEAAKVAAAPEDEPMLDAALAIRFAIDPVETKLAALESLRNEIQSAKARAGKGGPSIGFMEGESRDLEQGDPIAGSSEAPRFRKV
jgi:hypothetical protein